MKKLCSIQDLWCEKNKTKVEYTFIDPGKPEVRSRIDYILCNQYWAKLCKQCTIEPAPVPDHNTVVAVFERHCIERGHGYWKLNTQLLSETNYKEGVKKIFNNTRQEFENILSKRMLWDLCKIRIKEFSITYSIKRKQANKNKTLEIENKIKDIDTKLVGLSENNMIIKDNNVENIIVERQNLKEQLDKYYNEQAMGYYIRSRAKWI